MKKTVFDTKNKVEYEFSMADVREALINHFKVNITSSCYLDIDVFEGQLSKPPIVSMIVSNIKPQSNKSLNSTKGKSVVNRVAAHIRSLVLRKTSRCVIYPYFFWLIL